MNRKYLLSFGLILFALFLATPLFAGTIELLSGAKVEGRVIRKDDENLYVGVMFGGKEVERSYPLASIHAVTINGTRRVLNEKPAGGAPAKTAPAAGSKTPPAAGAGGGRSRAELDRMIEAVGRAPPDWFESTPLDYPQSLDLDWPKDPPGGGWNNQKNMGQYIWDIINPNPNRWQGAVRLLHHLLTMHQADPVKREKVMLSLAKTYHNLLEDHARGAFWLRAAGVEKDPKQFSRSAVTLAECYWRLGYPEEALKLLGKADGSFEMAKLLGDMGHTDKAVQLALAGAKDYPEIAYLIAADAQRVAGRTREAMQNYQKVLDIPLPAKPNGRQVKNRARATANLEAIKLFDQLDPKQVPDGDYVAASQGYEAAVEVTVTMSGGKISAVKVTNHREKQFYSSISETPVKIIAKQHVKGVDATSGATITSDAIINATAKALAKAKP